MAFLDAFLELGSAQAVTTSVASTNIVDTLANANVLEPGAWLRVAVQTAFVINDAGTLQVQLQTSDTEAMLDATSVTLVQSSAITASTDLTAGRDALVVKLPKNLKRYLRVYYVLGGTASAGNMDAHIVQNVDSLITDVEAT